MLRRWLGLTIAGLALLAGALFWWQPWDGGWVATPPCDRLVRVLPGTDGAFTVQEAGSRAVNDSSTTCVLGVTSADGRFTGTVRVFLLGTTDQARLLEEVKTGECGGRPDQAVSTVGPRASRACLLVVNGKALAGMYATVGDRFAAVNTELQGPSAAETELVAYAREVRVHVVDQALRLPADG